MIDQINDLLKKICYKLSHGSWFGRGSLNYVVDIKLFCKFSETDTDKAGMIESLIPKSVVGDIEKSSLSELLDEVNECLRFSGDEGSHPNKKYLFSKEFESDLDQLLEKIKSQFFENTEISKFWLKEGHPFYPVYWDYAFLIEKKESCFVLIGSSSD